MAGPVCDRATVIPENARFQTYKDAAFAAVVRAHQDDDAFYCHD
jgi:hypothetical protein